MGFTHNMSVYLFLNFFKKKLDLGFRDCCTFLSPYLSGDFSSFHTNTKDPQNFCHVIVVVFCCTKIMTMSYVARKYPRKIVLVVWKASLLTRYVPHFVPLPMQPMRRLSIGGGLVFFFWGWFPLVPPCSQCCSHHVHMGVPKRFPKLS
jgi:hypothetical protein